MPSAYQRQAINAYTAKSTTGRANDDAVDGSIAKIIRHLAPACIMRNRAPARSQSALYFLVIVTDRPDGKMRWRIHGTAVHLHIANVESLRKQLSAGYPPALIRICSTAEYVHGDQRLAREMQSLAQKVLQSAAPSGRAAFHVQARNTPFDLLREFESLCETDPTAAGLVGMKAVIAALHAYGALNPRLTGGIRGLLNEIERVDPQASAMLSTVLETAPCALSGKRHTIENIVKRILGSEQFDCEFGD